MNGQRNGGGKLFAEVEVLYPDLRRHLQAFVYLEDIVGKQGVQRDGHLISLGHNRNDVSRVLGLIHILADIETGSNIPDFLVGFDF